MSPAGFTIHSAIHAAREGAHCVLHLHSVNGVAVHANISAARCDGAEPPAPAW